MPVHDWIFDFVGSVQEVIPRHDWPEVGSDFWAVMERAFVRDGVKRGAAERALFTVAENAPPYTDRIRASLIEVARTYQVQANREAALEGDTSSLDRDAAAELSRGCDECGGSGLTSRYVRSRRAGGIVPVGFSCHLCPLGRWIAKQWIGKDGSRPVDLADYPDLWGREHKHAPATQAAADAPESATFRELWDRIRVRTRAESRQEAVNAP
jgi:hypothetical protein